MYLKLSIRNATRSVVDYLLYIFAMTILISILCIANCISILGRMQLNLQTESLPLLIVVIAVILIDYINSFMLKQRSKELATYMLLGMNKNKVSFLFLIELCLIGILCLLIGLCIGYSFYFSCFNTGLNAVENPLSWGIIFSTLSHSLSYFSMIEIISLVRMKYKIEKLQLGQLMIEERRYQPIQSTSSRIWKIYFFLSLVSLILMLVGIVFLPASFSSVLISIIIFPVWFSIFTFYKWFYAVLSFQRLSQNERLYHQHYLYQVAMLTTETKTSPINNSIFCLCLLFSACSFVFGMVMLQDKIQVYTRVMQQWMGFLQISICLIFFVIYFSILSLMQLVNLKRQANDIRLMYYLGKNQKELFKLTTFATLMKVLIPTILCFVILGLATIAINYKLNLQSNGSINNLLLEIVGSFIILFLVFYLSYCFLIHQVGKRYIKMTLQQ